MAVVSPWAELPTNELPSPVRYRDLAPVDRQLEICNVAYLAGAWVTIAAAAAVAARRPRWYTIGMAAVVISGRQHALLNVEHECIHNLFVTGGKRRNDRVGRWGCAAPCGSPYTTAKDTHLAHHRLLGHDADPDHELHASAAMESRRGLRRYLAIGAVGGHALRSLLKRGSGAGEERPAEPADLRSIATAHAALWAGSAATMGWWVYPVLWAGPLVTITSFWHIVRSYVEHALADDEATQHENRLITTVSNPLELSLLAPYNMNYHAEHHTHPFVPAPRLPAVRKRMAADGASPPVLHRRSYLGTLVTHYKALPRR